MYSSTSTKSTNIFPSSNESHSFSRESGDETSLYASETAELQQSAAEDHNYDAEDSYDFNKSDVEDKANSGNADEPPTVATSPSLSLSAASAEEYRPKKAWKQPSREAINLSLQAEKEAVPSKRRLLSDMYKIMANDELPFTIEQKDDDRMDQWIVKLNGFDEESDLYKDLTVLGLDCVELQMNFPDDYPFVPPFVYVARPRFASGTGFVIDGALCMELLAPQGWSPANSVETVIISIQSHLVIGKGRLRTVVQMGDKKRNQILQQLKEQKKGNRGDKSNEVDADSGKRRRGLRLLRKKPKDLSTKAGAYTAAEAKRSFQTILSIHKRDGWSKYWAKKG